ncbi:MAG: type VII secretion-associated serine protease mycosin [Mycobacterium sp.]|nr:type VII secretion-associated serine protease mycosin [Mycobacterium sp.]
MNRHLRRMLAVLLAVLTVAALTNPAVGLAIPPPTVDPALVPPDTTPGPEQAMRQSNACAQTVAVPEPDISVPAAGFVMLNISRAWQYSTGNGVPVAVIDTGVNPSPRLPVLGGGDYINGGDGLTDCDAHGTVVASIIAAAPRGAAMPPPMPAAPAFPPPVGRANPPIPLPPGPPDGVSGVAPHATLISIRQSSRAYEPVGAWSGGGEARAKAGTVATLARAIVHAANLGAKVINVSVASCVSAADPLDQRSIGAAVWYAASVKDVAIVAAAGNEGEAGCAQNAGSGSVAGDPRDWRDVRTISSPSWFADYVLSVGAVDTTGAPLSRSLTGPWVGAAAPGVGVVGLSAQNGDAVNAYPPNRPGEQPVPFAGTSFAAAYVSGVAALVRAKFPGLTARQVINRILRTAHNPPGGVDNQIGYGVVDPVAALTFDVPVGAPVTPGSSARVLSPPEPPPPPDRRATTFALVFAGFVFTAVAVVALTVRSRSNP